MLFRLQLALVVLSFVHSSMDVTMETPVNIGVSGFPFKNGSSAIRACSPCFAGKCSFTATSTRTQTLEMTTTSTSTTTTTGTSTTIGNSTTTTTTTTTTATSTTTATGTAEVLAKIGASVAMSEN